MRRGTQAGPGRLAAAGRGGPIGHGPGSSMETREGPSKPRNTRVARDCLGSGGSVFVSAPSLPPCSARRQRVHAGACFGGLPDGQRVIGASVSIRPGQICTGRHTQTVTARGRDALGLRSCGHTLRYGGWRGADGPRASPGQLAGVGEAQQSDLGDQVLHVRDPLHLRGPPTSSHVRT
jgi:hypothetical protein